MRVPSGKSGNDAPVGLEHPCAVLSDPGRSIRGVLSAVALATRPEFTVSAVTCREDHTRWSPAEARGDYRVVLVRRGRFHRAACGRSAELDPTLGYVGVRHQEERFAHPAGGDLCTAVSLAPTLWRTLTGDGPDPVASTVYVDARLELAHRRLHAAASGGDVDFALAEHLLHLLALTLERVAASQAPVDLPTRSADRAWVTATRHPMGWSPSPTCSASPHIGSAEPSPASSACR